MEIWHFDRNAKSNKVTTYFLDSTDSLFIFIARMCINSSLRDQKHRVMSNYSKFFWRCSIDDELEQVTLLVLKPEKRMEIFFMTYFVNTIMLTLLSKKFHKTWVTFHNLIYVPHASGKYGTLSSPYQKSWKRLKIAKKSKIVRK